MRCVQLGDLILYGLIDEFAIKQTIVSHRLCLLLLSVLKNVLKCRISSALKVKSNCRADIVPRLLEMLFTTGIVQSGLAPCDCICGTSRSFRPRLKCKQTGGKQTQPMLIIAARSYRRLLSSTDLIRFLYIKPTTTTLSVEFNLYVVRTERWYVSMCPARCVQNLLLFRCTARAAQFWFNLL